MKKSANGSFSIKVKLNGKNGTINVVPPNPGTSGCMALKLGTSAAAGDRYSVQFGVESKIKNVDGKVFSAKKPANQGICPSPGVWLAGRCLPGEGGGPARLIAQRAR